MTDAVAQKLAELRMAIRAVADHTDADLILYAGSIETAGMRLLSSAMRMVACRRNAWLYLTTYGGDPSAAYQIARCAQRHHKDGIVTVVIDSICKSAGTLIALGSDELVMSEMAELGPLDVQVGKPDALWERTSGLTPTHALEKLRQETLTALEEYFLSLRFKSGLQITTRTALDVSVALVTGLFEPVYAQIDPMRLGEIGRAMSIAKHYGDRLCNGRENIKQGTIDSLIKTYPSHDFVIAVDEVRELFNAVRQPTPEEAALLALLEPYVESGLAGDNPSVVILNTLLNNGDTDVNVNSTDLPGTAEQAGEGNDAQTRAEAGNQGTPQRGSESSNADQTVKRDGEMRTGVTT